MFEQIGIIIVVNLLLYFNTLKYKFVSDDFSVFKNPPVFKNGWHKAWLRFIGATKLQSRSIRFLFLKGKLHIAIIKSEEFEHFIALVFHILICIAIYFAFGASQISFIAALLYSTNPVNNQGTIWPGGRGYALPILSLLTAIAVPCALPVLILFCTSFTVGFLAPLALIGSGIDIGWLLFIPTCWLIHSTKFYKAVKTKHDTESFAEDKIIHPKKLILAIKTFGFYTLLCIIPFRITFYHNFLQSSAGSMKHKNYTLCRYFWLGLLTMIGMITYAVVVPWNTLTWALFAFAITIAPFCNLVRANQEIAERFAALPNVFLMYALAQILVNTGLTQLVVAFLVFYAVRTFYTLMMYKDEYFITEVCVCEDPHAWWVWHCRAMKRWDTQSYKEALILWAMARLISPNEFKILINLATCLRLLKNDQEADAFLLEAEKNIVPGQEKQAQSFLAAHRKGKLPILL